MTKEEFYSRALSFDEVGEQVDIFKKEKIKYEQEIERLNNIINELEKFLNKRINFYHKTNITNYFENKDILDKLQELKGSYLYD